MTRSIKMLALAACIAIVSLAIPFSGLNRAWISDVDYSFFLQVALPRLGIAVSSIIGGYAGVLFLSHSQDKNLHELAVTMSVIDIALLIGGLFISDAPYVLMYSLVCPPLVGFGVMKLSERVSFIRKRAVMVSLIALLLLPSIALLSVGIQSTDWVMIFDFGTGFRVLFGALIGGLVANIKAGAPM
ncbi:hypothetical protein [Pantoea sp. B65]|uniref:hypothetical protein n=1 Tax=Pantoea sp. B65 TaxID=2813359 RepID=UPI0039B62314